MTYSPGDLYDRLSILHLKRERQADYITKGEIEEFEGAVKACGPWDQVLFGQIKEVNGRIWDLESDLRLGKEGLLGLDEVGRRSIQIRDLNRLRIELRNEVDKHVCLNPRVETKGSRSLDNAVPPLSRDMRWLSILYQRAEAEMLLGRTAGLRYFTLLVLTALSVMGLLAWSALERTIVLTVGTVLAVLEISHLLTVRYAYRRNQKLLMTIDALKLRPDYLSLDADASLLEELRSLVCPRAWGRRCRT